MDTRTLRGHAAALTRTRSKPHDVGRDMLGTILKNREAEHNIFRARVIVATIGMLVGLRS